MSNALFPTFRGLTWDVLKIPKFNTIIQTAASGREVRVTKRVDPVWEFEFNLSVLDDSFIDSSGYSELKNLEGFFMQRQGAFGSFLYSDPTDKTVVGAPIGVGDGSTRVFQLQRPVASAFSETVQNPQNVSAIYVNGVSKTPLTDYFWGMENLLLQSQAFNVAPWVLGNSGASNPVITANSTTAPDGTATADTLAFPSTVGGAVTSYISQNVTGVGFSGITFTYSVWLKVASGTASIAIRLSDTASQSFTTTATVTTTWQRFTVTGTFYPDSGFALRVPQVLIIANNIAAANVFAWGAQLERNVAASGYTITTTAQSNPLGSVTFVTAPASGLPITADFTFYYRLRFKEDLQEFNNFLYNLWEVKQMRMVSVKI